MADSGEVALDLSPLLKVYKDGHVERMLGTTTVPASVHPDSGVESKDVVISPETGLSARLYRPKSTAALAEKLPLLVYFHGGGFCIESAFSPTYHNHLNALVAEANVVVVSVDYRLAPEHPIPVAYEDSWAALKWVAGNCSEEWINTLADVNRLYLAGDSAGANIAHHMAVRIGTGGLIGIKLRGIVLVHPYFWGKEPIGEERKAKPEQLAMIENLWRFIHPATSGSDDRLVNPALEPDLERLGCEKVVVFVAEKDLLKDRGWFYSETLKKKGWAGNVEVVEAKEEHHVFHLWNPSCENAGKMIKEISLFLNQV